MGSGVGGVIAPPDHGQFRQFMDLFHRVGVWGHLLTFGYSDRQMRTPLAGLRGRFASWHPARRRVGAGNTKYPWGLPRGRGLDQPSWTRPLSAQTVEDSRGDFSNGFKSLRLRSTSFDSVQLGSTSVDCLLMRWTSSSTPISENRVFSWLCWPPCGETGRPEREIAAAMHVFGAFAREKNVISRLSGPKSRLWSAP